MIIVIMAAMASLHFMTATSSKGCWQDFNPRSSISSTAKAKGC